MIKQKVFKFAKYGVVLVALFTATILYGCFGNEMYIVAKEKVSEMRYNLYASSSEKVSATFMSGLRESEYIINGYHTDLKDFGILTFTLIGLKPTEGATYTLTYNDKSFSGALEKNPYNDTLVVDIETIIDDTTQTINTSLTMGDFTQSLTLESVSKNWTVTYDDALQIGCKELKSQLKSMMIDGEFAGEGYVKIINDQTVDSGYYWYVNFVDRNGQNYAVIIDPTSKAILATKK